MILLRNLKNPILRKSILLQSLGVTSPYTVISKDSKNIMRGLTIQKLIKLSSNKKCNKAQDVIFCNMMLETFIHHNIANQMELNSMENQVARLINNSLAYIHQLSLLETLMLANNCLQLIKIKRINLNTQVLDKFLVKINTNIQNLIRKVRDGKYMQQIVKYTQFLVINKKSPEFTKNFINHIISQPKNQKQVIQILLVLLSFRYKNNLFIAKSVKKVLEQEISQKIIDQPLQSPLIDITILKIFLQLKLHIRPPYNCIPKWLFILAEKVQRKYLTNKYNASVHKKIQFLQWYTKFLLDVNLMSQSTCLSSKDYECLTLSVGKICEQLDYIDGDIYQTIMEFVSSLHSYLIFARKYPVHYNNPDKQIEQTMLKIFYRYFTQINFSNISPQQQQVILKCLSKYLSILAQLPTQSSDITSPITQGEIYKIFNKTVQIFNNQIIKYSQQADKYKYIFILLDSIGLLYQKVMQFSAKGHLSTATNSIINIVNTLDLFFANISFQTVDQIYKQGRNIDFITISYLFIIKNVTGNNKQDFFPKILLKLLQHLKKGNLSSVVQTCIYLKQKNNCGMKEQIMKLCEEIKCRTQSIQFESPSEKQWIQQKNLGSSYTYKSEQEHLVANLINIIRCIENSQLSQVFKFWFIDNYQIIKSFWFSQKNPDVFNISWNYLIKCIRYLYSISYSCGIDFISDLMRIGHRQKSLSTAAVNKFMQIFDDRSVNISLSKKVDQFTIYKYAWLITLLTQYKTQQKNQTPQSQLKIRRKSVRANQSSPYIQKQDIEQSLPNQLQYQIDLLQFQKLKEQISLIIYDIKQPLQISPHSFKSTYLCKIINWCMTNLVGYIKQMEVNYKKESKQIQDNFVKRKQKLFSDIPIEQIIYYLSINNAIDKAYWLEQISVHYLMSFLQKNYSKTSQYNMLLAFPTQKLETKKAHEALLSKELQKYQKVRKQSEKQQTATKERQQTHPYPSILKYYYHLLGSDSKEQRVKQNVQMIMSKIVFSDKQIVEYWINKNIVLRTVSQKLIQAMLQRLLHIRYRYADDLEITYCQYTLILNTLITLLQTNRINKYKVAGNKQNKQLVGWVHGYLQIKISNIKSQVYLYDYITITQYFGIRGLEYPLHAIISQSMETNTISILDILYKTKYILNQDNLVKFKSLLKRTLDRCLGEDYYSLDFSCEFRVQVFFNRVFAIVLMQNNQQLLNWFNCEVLNRINIYNLQQYLYKQQNDQKLCKLGMFKKLNDQILSQNIETPIQKLLKRISTHQQKRIQQKISLSQTKRAQKLPNHKFSIVQIKQTELSLYRKQNSEDLVYLTGGIEQTADEVLEVQYIKIFLRNLSKIQIIFFI